MAMTAHALREVVIEAVGDDFAQVSGQWLRGTRVAQFLARADRAWVFAAPDAQAAQALMDSLGGQTGAWIVGIAPGMQPGWDAQDTPALRALLDGTPEQPLVGLALSMPPPACVAPDGPGGTMPCQGACSHCHGTNRNV